MEGLGYIKKPPHFWWLLFPKLKYILIRKSIWLHIVKISKMRADIYSINYLF